MEFDEDERALVDEMFLLTSKPVIYAANIAEDDIGKPDNDLVKLVEKSRRRKFRNVSYLRQGGGRIIQSSLGRKSDVFLESYGIEESGLKQTGEKCYKLYVW